jgi:hypothetical protein
MLGRPVAVEVRDQRRPLGHPPAHARGTAAARFAGERHPQLVATAAAAGPRLGEGPCELVVVERGGGVRRRRVGLRSWRGRLLLGGLRARGFARRCGGLFAGRARRGTTSPRGARARRRRVRGRRLGRGPTPRPAVPSWSPARRAWSWRSNSAAPSRRARPARHSAPCSRATAGYADSLNLRDAEAALVRDAVKHAETLAVAAAMLGLSVGQGCWRFTLKH